MRSKYNEVVLSAINLWWAKYHVPPTIREIMAETGVTSSSVVFRVARLSPDIRVVLGKFVPLWVDEALRGAGLGH